MADDREAVLERTEEGNRTHGQEQAVLGLEGHWEDTSVYSE